jgi:hypothetical protein
MPCKLEDTDKIDIDISGNPNESNFEEKMKNLDKKP